MRIEVQNDVMDEVAGKKNRWILWFCEEGGIIDFEDDDTPEVSLALVVLRGIHNPNFKISSFLFHK